jgi:glutamyl-tRNA reductase
MTVLAFSLNHHRAPLDMRGRFAFGAEQIPQALADLRRQLSDSVSEAALLSTCNRTELYLVGEAQPETLASQALNWLSAQTGNPVVPLSLAAQSSMSRAITLSPTALAPHVQSAQNDDAARHVFRVASGLDSMVLGEPQILGQMKAAVRQASTAGTLGSTLHQLFQRSFAVAKEVRTRTEIGSHTVSMAAAAVRLAAELFEDLSSLHVLFVGAGEMNEGVATHFSARQPSSMAFALRHPARGEALAKKLGAKTLPLSELPNQLQHYDVVISCTSSTLPLIGMGAVESALKARRRRPMLLVDLAVPRDIEAEVGELPDAYLYTVDDLAARVRNAGDKRLAAVEQAEAIVDIGVSSFAQWCEQRSSVPLIQALQQRAEEWQRLEIQRASRLLARGDGVEAAMRALAQGLSQKMMHGTLRALHEAQGDGRRQMNDTASQLWLRRPPECLAASALTAHPSDNANANANAIDDAATAVAEPSGPGYPAEQAQSSFDNEQLGLRAAA